MALVTGGSALADGTETLGPPSVAVASGSGVLAAGTGMQAFPNAPKAFSFSVPAGATVKQVLLYWEGHHSAPFAAGGDATASVNGIAVAGTLIGGPTAFFSQFSGSAEQTETFSAYRADITGLGLVSAGANTLTVSDLLFQSNFPEGFPFNQGNDGAGVLVVYELPGATSVIEVRDGLDLAFASFAPPLDTTVPQTFNFAPAPSARSATLATLAGSVSGPDLGGVRGNKLVLTFDVGGTIELVNPWQSAQGAAFDALNTPFTVPAGASSLTVQALSVGGDRPASFAWIGAAVAIEQPPPPPSGQGCTPGYWKNHLGAWPPTGYSPSQTLSSVFAAGGLGTLGSSTLLQALEFGGGSSLTQKKQNLLRIGVASLLNAAHPGVSFPMTTAQVIAAINSALASNDATTIENLKNELDTLNNAGCPLGRA